MSGGVLAVDLGKTGCRAALWTGTGRRVDAEGMGAAGLAAPAGGALAEAAILAVAGPLLRAAGIERLEAACVGAAGALAAPDAARDLAQRLCASLPARAAAVASDATASHAGALGGAPGVVLVVGTGAVALGMGLDGTMRRADGWGPWLGDEGGGAWIGLQGLRAVLRAADGRGPATALLVMAEARFGPLSGLAAMVEGHASPPRLAAGFAGDVAAAAASGDKVAAGLLRQAAASLATTVQATGSRVAAGGPVRFALAGGLLRLGPILTGPLMAAIRDGAPWLEPTAAGGTALDGARLLALDTNTLYERHVVRHVVWHVVGATHLDAASRQDLDR